MKLLKKIRKLFIIYLLFYLFILLGGDIKEQNMNIITGELLIQLFYFFSVGTKRNSQDEKY